MSSNLMTEEQWLEKYKATLKKSDLSERLNESKDERIARITSDPKPQWRADAPKNYPTTEKHFIIVVDADEANASMPEADLLYQTPHKVGGVLVSDRAEIPKGWIKKPANGTSIETIKKEYPALYEVMNDKGNLKF
jgi:hypothetical protein